MGEFPLIVFFMVFVFIIIFIFVLYKKIIKIEHHIGHFSITLANLKTTIERHSLDYQQQVKGEMQAAMTLRCLEVISAVKKQTHRIHSQLFEHTPRSHGFSEDEMKTYFSPAQITVIYEFWTLYEKYLIENWLTENNSFKTVFKRTDKENMILSSQQLLSKLELLLHQFNRQLS